MTRQRPSHPDAGTDIDTDHHLVVGARKVGRTTHPLFPPQLEPVRGEPPTVEADALSTTDLRALDRAGESGQALVVGVFLMALAMTLAFAVAEVARAHVAQARVQRAAELAAASIEHATPVVDPVRHAKAIARANGATSLTVHWKGRIGREVVVAHGKAPSIVGVRLGHDLVATAVVHVDPGGSSGDGTFPGGVNNTGVQAGGGMYTGPLVAVDAAVICPEVAAQYHELQRAASADGVRLWAVSGWRSYAEQAVLYARYGAHRAAPPGKSLHHRATEFDLAVGPVPNSIYSWLSHNAPSHGFVQRYSWEPWHWGSVVGC